MEDSRFFFKEKKNLKVLLHVSFGEITTNACLFSLFATLNAECGDILKQTTLYSLKLNMGRALTKLGRFVEARVLLFEVITVYTEWWGRHHPETMRAIDELAWAFMVEGKGKQATSETGGFEIQKAGELWTEVLNFYQSTDGDGSDMVTRVEANLQYLHSLRPLRNVDDRRWMDPKPFK